MHCRAHAGSDFVTSISAMLYAQPADVTANETTAQRSHPWTDPSFGVFRIWLRTSIMESPEQARIAPEIVAEAYHDALDRGFSLARIGRPPFRAFRVRKSVTTPSSAFWFARVN